MRKPITPIFFEKFQVLTTKMNIHCIVSSEKLSETDQMYMQQLVGYISDRGNLFDQENTTMKNLVTGATFDAKSMLFLLGSVTKGKEALISS